MAQASQEGLPPAVAELVLNRPEKFLELDFASLVSPAVFNTICELFGRSIVTVFLWPVVILFIVSPLCLYITRDARTDTRTSE